MEREKAIKGIFGDDVRVVIKDIPYGDDPVAAVKALIESYEDCDQEIVAIEAIAPFPVLIKLVGRQQDLGVTFIRAQYERDEIGRIVVTGKDEKGRDLFKFSHYEELVRIELETRRLEPQSGKEESR